MGNNKDIKLVQFTGLFPYLLLGDNGCVDYGEKRTLPVTDSCELYRLVVKGNVSESDYDSIRHYLRRTVYRSKLLDKSILFDHGHSESPELYVHAKLEGEHWKSIVKQYLGGASPFAFTESGVAMLSSV